MKSKTKLFKIFAFSILILQSERAFSAACCGSSSAVPSLLGSEDKAQISAGLSYAESHTDVLPDGVWVRKSKPDVIETLKLDGSILLSDLWQIGTTIPIVRKTKKSSNVDDSVGLGDIALNLGYEILPDWDYNPIRPRGVTYFEVILPTGRSIQESDNLYALDARGRGFYALGVGALFTKAYKKWDFIWHLEIHRSFNKSIENSQFQGTLKPGLGGMSLLGAGFNFDKWRLGSNVQWTYEDRVEAQGNISSKGSPQRFTTASLSAAFLASPKWSVSLTYSDQFLLGEPVNTTLSRGVSLNVLHKWQR